MIKLKKTTLGRVELMRGPNIGRRRYFPRFNAPVFRKFNFSIRGAEYPATVQLDYAVAQADKATAEVMKNMRKAYDDGRQPMSALAKAIELRGNFLAFKAKMSKMSPDAAFDAALKFRSAAQGWTAAIGADEPAYVNEAQITKMIEEADKAVTEFVKKANEAQHERRITNDYVDEIVSFRNGFHEFKDQRFTRLPAGGFSIITPFPKKWSGVAYLKAKKYRDVANSAVAALKYGSVKNPIANFADAKKRAIRAGSGFVSGDRRKVTAKKIFNLPRGVVMAGILSTSTNVANVAPAVATKWNVTVYRQNKRRFGGSLYWERETDFDGSTADEATQKAQAYVQRQGWQLASA